MAMGFGRRLRPGPKTDMQNRCRYIEDRANAIKAALTTEPDSPLKAAVSELAYLVNYLSAIVEKHLRTGEK